MFTFWSMSALLISIIIPMYALHAQESTTTPDAAMLIMTPEPGQALQGTVLIVVETNFDVPTSAILSFSYQDDPRETWFLLQEFQNIGQQELSFEWDTTTITDGNYTIRLSAQTEQGQQSVYAQGVRVRNYTAAETNTPQPTSTPAPQDTLAPTMTPTRTRTAILPTSTPLPPNPAQITENDIWNSLIIGGLVALGLIGIFGVYQLLRNRHRSKG